MAKPLTLDGYSEQITRDCERVLVTLLRNLGPHKNSLVLIGGLTPRYLVPERPPIVPQHAGTLDLDVVIDLVVLEDTEAYRTLEDNLKKIGFERGENDKGQKVNWRWKVRMEDVTNIVLELLADHPDLRGGRAQPLPDEGQISALNIPHSSIVFDLYDTAEVTAELIGGNGQATETIRHANIVSFTCLKSIAYDDRQERKDAHDLVYCLEHVSAKGRCPRCSIQRCACRQAPRCNPPFAVPPAQPLRYRWKCGRISQGRPSRGGEVRTWRR